MNFFSSRRRRNYDDDNSPDRGYGQGGMTNVGHHHNTGYNQNDGLASNLTGTGNHNHNHNAAGFHQNTGIGSGPGVHTGTGPNTGLGQGHHLGHHNTGVNDYDQNNRHSTINPVSSGTTIGHDANTGLGTHGTHGTHNSNLNNTNGLHGHHNQHQDHYVGRGRNAGRPRKSGGLFSRRNRNYDDDHHYNDRKHSYGSHNDRRSRSRRSGRSRSRSSRHRKQRQTFDLENGIFNARPSFGQWLKFIWLDLLTMLIMGAIGLGVYFADPAPSRSFPVTFARGSTDVVFPTVAYPLRDEIIPIWAAALMAALIPIFIILVMQVRVKSFWDANNAILGLLYSLIAAAVFQVFLKWLIGGLRPHFLAVCNPDPTRLFSGGNGYQGIMFDRRICRGSRKAVNDALESFPSGHSTAAFAGFIFLYYYLNAKMKVFSNYHPHFWKLIAIYAPVLGAVLIAGAMTIDEYHHWYDVLAGGIIGTLMATSAYRMVYASVWDFRFNHIPMTRHTPFSFGAGAAGAGGFEAAVFTRKAGWGTEEAFGGAPFDAAYHLRGQVNGFNTAVHNHSNKHNHGLGHNHTHGHNDTYTNGREHKHGLSSGNDLGHGTTHTDQTYRQGDVEHHAVAGEPGVVGTGTGTGIGTHGHNNSRTLDPSAQGVHGVGHRNDGYRSDHELGHRNDGHIGTGTGNITSGRNEAWTSDDPGHMTDGSNRHGLQRKSIERKAVGPSGAL